MSDDVLSWLPAMRQAGFFKDYASLSDVELLASLEQQRRQEYEDLFQDDVHPEAISDELELLALDHERVVALDLEADVCEENEVYTEVLHLFAVASGGQFNPSDIKEVWQTEEGPIRVSYRHKGSEVVFEPQYQDDWISTEVFESITSEMENKGAGRFMVFLGKEGEGYGQMAVFVRLNPEEQQILEQKLGWKFVEE